MRYMDHFKELYGRRTHGEAQAVANELGEPIRYWPYSLFGSGMVATPRKKPRGRLRQR